jgi:hypothetical protein
VAEPPPQEQRPLELESERGPVRLLFVDRGDRSYLIPSGTRSYWSIEIVRAGSARARRPGRVVEAASVRLVTDPALAQDVRGDFLAKYGRPAWDRYFAASHKIIELEFGPRPEPVLYADQVRNEFDAAAPFYQDAVGANPFERYLKRRSLEHLATLFEHADPLIEIGPGTGFETLPLLAQGHRILAVDLSEGMLGELRARADASGVGERLRTRVGRLGRLDAALADVPPGSYRGAFSTFGAFNLEPDLGVVPDCLARVLAPGAPLCLGVLNPHGAIPMVYEGAIGGWSGVRARLSNPIRAGGNRYPLDIYLSSARGLAHRFAPWFDLESVRTVSVLAPPFRSPRLLRTFSPEAFRQAERLDRWLCGFGFANALGEWILVTLRRTGHG